MILKSAKKPHPKIFLRGKVKIKRYRSGLQRKKGNKMRVKKKGNEATFHLLDESAVASALGLKVGTLQRWRLFGRGPKFRKCGGAVRYSESDLSAWLDSRPAGGESESAAGAAA